MLAHIHELQSQAERRLLAINRKTLEVAERLHNDLLSLGFLELKDVLPKDNQYHRYYFVADGLDEPQEKIAKSLPQLNLRRFVQRYITLAYYQTTLLATLVDGFFPQRNFRYKLPSRKAGEMHEVASLVVLCQQAYSPAHEAEWPSLRERICSFLGSLGCAPKGEAASSAIPLSSTKLPPLPDVGPQSAALDPCAIEQHRPLAVTTGSKVRIVLSKQRWPELLELLAPDASGKGPLGSGELESIVNLGRVPWDIRQQSMVVRVGGQERLRVYNNSDYELVPHVGGRVVQKFELRCVLIEILLYLMLEQKSRADRLMAELRQVANRPDELVEAKNVEFAGVYYPQEDFITELRLATARKRQQRNKASVIESILSQ